MSCRSIMDKSDNGKWLQDREINDWIYWFGWWILFLLWSNREAVHHRDTIIMCSVIFFSFLFWGEWLKRWTKYCDGVVDMLMGRRLKGRQLKAFGLHETWSNIHFKPMNNKTMSLNQTPRERERGFSRSGWSVLGYFPDFVGHGFLGNRKTFLWFIY